MDTEKLWTGNFITVSVINFLVFLMHFLLMVTVASYAVNKFHANTGTAGLVASIFIIGALIGRFATGHVIEDLGNKRVLIVGTICFIATAVLYYAAVTLPLLIIIRLLHGIAHGIASTATGTIVAKIIPDRKRGEGIGYYGMSVIMASALGPFMGIFLLHHADFKVLFLVSSILAVIAFSISLAVREPADVIPEQDATGTEKSFQLSNFFETKAMPISIIALILGFSGSVVMAFISLYTQEIHLEKAASFYFVVSAMVSLISRPFAGRLFDLRGANFVIYPCLIIYAIGMLLFSQASHDITLLVAGVILGLSYGNLMSSTQTISIKVVLPHRFGLATATYYVFLDLGIAVGPYLLGHLIPLIGYRGMYFMMAIVALATIPLYHFAHGRKVLTG